MRHDFTLLLDQSQGIFSNASQWEYESYENLRKSQKFLEKWQSGVVLRASKATMQLQYIRSLYWLRGKFRNWKIKVFFFFQTLFHRKKEKNSWFFILGKNYSNQFFQQWWRRWRPRRRRRHHWKKVSDIQHWCVTAWKLQLVKLSTSKHLLHRCRTQSTKRIFPVILLQQLWTPVLIYITVIMYDDSPKDSTRLRWFVAA